MQVRMYWTQNYDSLTSAVFVLERTIWSAYLGTQNQPCLQLLNCWKKLGLGLKLERKIVMPDIEHLVAKILCPISNWSGWFSPYRSGTIRGTTFLSGLVCEVPCVAIGVSSATRTLRWFFEFQVMPKNSWHYVRAKTWEALVAVLMYESEFLYSKFVVKRFVKRSIYWDKNSKCA